MIGGGWIGWGLLFWLVRWALAILALVLLYRLVQRVGEVADELRSIRRHLAPPPDAPPTLDAAPTGMPTGRDGD